MNRAIVAIITDQHGGFKLGMMPPGVTVYDEGENGQLVPRTPTMTAWQELIWNDIFLPGLDKIESLLHNDPLYVLEMGDPTHGNAHPDQLVSTRLADQILIAKANQAPWLKFPTLKAFRLIAGTDAHEFGEGSSTLLLEAYLKEMRPGLDVRALYHGLANIAGVDIDYTHHGPGAGIRVWTEGNVARLYLRDRMLRDLRQGLTPAQIYLRGHVHQWVNVVECIRWNGVDYESRLLVVPPMSGPSNYAIKVTQSTGQVTTGFAALEVVDGEILRVHDLSVTKDIRTKERL